MKTTLRRQRGVTLLVGLIMLVLMTLIAVSVFNLGKGNLQIVANMQYRNDSLNAAQDAIEEVISKTDFTVYPPVPLFGNGNSKSYDVNGDGVADVNVSIGSTKDPAKPTCISAQVIQNGNLNPFQSNPTLAQADAGCMANLQQDLGLTGPAAICAGIISQMASATGDALTALQQQSAALGCPAMISAAVSGGSGASLCADSLWEVRATATDKITNAKAVSTTGVRVRIASSNIAVACP